MVFLNARTSAAMNSPGNQTQPDCRRRRFLFATGIEGSYPTIEWKGKTIRVDEMAKCFHYDRWREDFELVKELGLEFLRYGPPYFSTHLGSGRYDWSFVDETFNELQRLG